MLKSKTQKMKFIKDYLFETSYDQLNYKAAMEYFKEQNGINGPILPGCSSIMSNGAMMRNFDWFYDESAEAVVHSPATDEFNAVVGICTNVPGLTNEFVKSGEASELYEILPFFMTDGINDKGLIATMNVVPNEKGDNKEIVAPKEKEKVCALMLIRYILDHYNSASEAVEKLSKEVTIFHPEALIKMNYNLHFMLTDPNDVTYLIEFINGEMVVEDITTKPFMTNFHLHDVTFNRDGSVYGPGDVPEGHDAKQDNNIEDHGQGLERYNIINSEHNANGGHPMFSTLEELAYTRIYKSSKKPSDPFWYSEYCLSSLKVNTDPSEFEKYIDEADKDYKSRVRDGATSQTVHSAIYDYNNGTPLLNLVTQENYDDVHTFALEQKPEPVASQAMVFHYPIPQRYNYKNLNGAHVVNIDARQGTYNETYPSKTPDGHPLGLNSKLFDVDTGAKFRWNTEKWISEDIVPVKKAYVSWQCLLGKINGSEVGSQEFDIEKPVVLNYAQGDHPFCYLPITEDEARKNLEVLINDVETKNYSIDVEKQTITFDSVNENDIIQIGYVGVDVLSFTFADTFGKDVYPSDLVNLDIITTDGSSFLFAMPHNLLQPKGFTVSSNIKGWMVGSVDWPAEYTNTSVTGNTLSFEVMDNQFYNEVKVHMGELPPTFKAVLEQNNDLVFYYDNKDHSDAKNVWVEKDMPTDPKDYTDWPWPLQLNTINFDKSMNEYTGLTNTSYMFCRRKWTYDKTAFKNLNMQAVVKADSMFKFTLIDSMPEFTVTDPEKLVLEDASRMFSGSTITRVTTEDLNFCENLVKAEEMFAYCTDLESFEYSETNSKAFAKITNANSFLYNCTKLAIAWIPRAFANEGAEIDAMFNHDRLLTTIYITDSDINLTRDRGGNMFADCQLLVGSQGSTINNTGINNSRAAKVDEGTSSPGFFTVYHAAQKRKKK